jgi:hypothetical protein
MAGLWAACLCAADCTAGSTAGDDRSLTILIYASTSGDSSGATAFPVLGLEVCRMMINFLCVPRPV